MIVPASNAKHSTRVSIILNPYDDISGGASITFIRHHPLQFGLRLSAGILLVLRFNGYGWSRDSI